MALFLRIIDDTPTSYETGGWQVFPSGNFCPGPFQFFGTELQTPSLKHPLVRSGTATLRITAIISEPPFDLVTAEGTFALQAGPAGCAGGSPPTGGDPAVQSFSRGASSVSVGSTIRLSANALDSDSSALTFFFWVSSTSSSKGNLISQQQVSGCQTGCSATFDFLASPFPTSHFFTVEVTDGSATDSSGPLQVTVTSGGGGPPPPPADTPTPCVNTCGATQISVDAGPVTQQVVGGLTLPLQGRITGGVGGAVVPASAQWTILNDGGLGAQLQLQDPAAVMTSLVTPDVNQDINVVLELGGIINNCSCQDQVTVTLLAEAPATADLGVSLSAAPDPVSVGGSIAYTIGVTNNGPGNASGVELRDVLGGNVSFVSASPAQCSFQAATATVTCALGSLNSGQTATVTVNATANNPGLVQNNAFVVSSSIDPNPNNDQASISTTAATVTTDLALTLTGPAGAVPLGADFDYVAVVTNNGPVEAPGVVLTDVLPAGVSFVSATATQGNCQGGASVSCTIGTLPVSSPVQVTIKVTANQPGMLSNIASVSSSVADSNPSNNSVTVLTEVTDAEADLSITVSVEVPGAAGQGGAGQALGLSDFPTQATPGAPVRVMQGGEVSYVTDVRNNGPDPATSVVVTHALAEGLDVAEVVSNPGSCVNLAGIVTCTIQTLLAGEEARVRLTVRANASFLVTNEVSVQANQVDPDNSNNTSSVDIRIRSLPGLFATTHQTNLTAVLDDTVPALANSGVFVGLALHNPGGSNTINFQSLDASGNVLADGEQDEDVAALGQRAILTQDLAQADTIVAEGLRGPVQGFFAIGNLSLRRFDGVGNRLEDRRTLFLAQAREIGSEVTVVFLFNPALNQAAEIDLTLFSPQGTVLGSTEVLLEPSGSLLSSIRQLFGDGLDLADGFIQVEADRPVRGFGAVFMQDSLIAMPAMRGFLASELSAPHFAVGADGVDTRLRFLNVGSQDAIITVTAFFDNPSLAGADSAQGTFEVPVGQLGEVSLAELLQLPVGQLGRNLLGGFLEIELDGGNLGGFPVEADVLPIISYLDESQKTNSSLPMVEGDGGTETLFLQVAMTRGNNPFQGLAVFNPQNEPVQVTIQAYNAQGIQTAEKLVILPARSRAVGLLNNSIFFESNFEQQGGYLRVLSDSPVISYSLFGGRDFLSAIGGQEPLQ